MLFFFSFVKTNFIKENLGKFQQLIFMFLFTVVHLEWDLDQ